MGPHLRPPAPARLRHTRRSTVGFARETEVTTRPREMACHTCREESTVSPTATRYAQAGLGRGELGRREELGRRRKLK